MKLLIVIYDSGIEEDIVALTKELALPGWTKAFGAQGHGGTGTKLGDPIWPGTNNTLYVGLPDERVAEVCAALEALKATFRRNPGITVFVLPLEEGTTSAANNRPPSASSNGNAQGT
ncbi:MAG: hypothetical protein COZ06_02240 [Armatimonadetes bacterium CG_4_10_14_3_um_filter_66_18]|nr:hypothetical protein [Armatimonadota bacterium]OIO93071.1 MAG: hypothetical protein AUJ96_31075 [Armatimonadetes bacterium CG2_30_66_41]PIU93710.1 MAG: hypothetical protein COS65_11600 [Armatimonadetes bacterium CG06_land_8_20_14_3_00_66_21]PIX46601.1 MAG: hypothetical protein COZ57_11265 [Armatimonadetes bacterium CG_4_8_14_3_um_filter_66_20]PIY53121.1 MAG: hypothetical protein COZ06_02240 [Armatimonadetes bacterium CG_4_10_14_3_um_filter_66_18]PIZ49011.1 MAG: hypothetical protein COY42_05